MQQKSPQYVYMCSGPGVASQLGCVIVCTVYTNFLD